MKSILTAVIVVLSFFAGGRISAQNNSIGLPDAAFETLKRAVTLVDEGMYEAALTLCSMSGFLRYIIFSVLTRLSRMPKSFSNTRMRRR